MARPIAANHADQRRAILDAAATVFAQSSYPAASMAQVAAASGASKARLYHYYESKEAILFDLLDRHTERLVALTLMPESTDLRALIRLFLAEYETSATRHIALLNDVKFLAADKRAIILTRERAVVAAFAHALHAFAPATPAAAVKPKTMMLFGMMNWTFTWLRADGSMTYADYAEHVIATLERGLN